MDGKWNPRKARGKEMVWEEEKKRKGRGKEKDMKRKGKGMEKIKKRKGREKGEKRERKGREKERSKGRGREKEERKKDEKGKDLFVVWSEGYFSNIWVSLRYR